MVNISEFRLFGEQDSEIEQAIQASLPFRGWASLSSEEKTIALQDMVNKGWLDEYSQEILGTIEYLNQSYLRQCPGRNLHAIKPARSYGPGDGNHHDRMKAAYKDFRHIFLSEANESMVMRMLSKFAEAQIDFRYYRLAKEEADKKTQADKISSAFEKFDKYANCLNHIFEQFSINQVVTRSGFIPRQDESITLRIYEPTLKILSNPQWESVNSDISKMFNDFATGDYPETITKAHSAIQRFLQIIVGEEGKNGKGEVGKLFSTARNENLIPINRFTEPLINVLQGYFSSERATKSSAKPALEAAEESDALLMMNLTMVFLQHSLQMKPAK